MPTSISPRKFREWRRRWRRVRQVLTDSLEDFFREDSLLVSASIAYHSLLGIFPFLILLTSLSGYYIRHLELTGRLAIVLDRYLPMKPDFILQNLESVSRSYGRVGLLSFFLLLWSSSGIFLPLEKALNRAWDIKMERAWWKRRLLALEMAVTVALLVFVSFVLVGVNVYVHNWLRHWRTPLPSAFIELGYYAALLAITFGISLAMFVMIFGRLPDKPMRLRQVLPSALVTAIFWEAARSLFTLLLPRLNYRHIYGSIGVVVALMTWAYVSSAVVLFGAQVSHALYGTLEGETPDEPISTTGARSPVKAR
jgi:YihY family inner membrane protein